VYTLLGWSLPLSSRVHRTSCWSHLGSRRLRPAFVLVTWLFLLPKAARRQLSAWQCVAACLHTYGGRIQAENLPQGGLAFIATLPIRPARHNPVAASRASARLTRGGVMSQQPGSSCRVLLVDDYELIRAGIRSLLLSEPDIDVVGDVSTGCGALAATRLLRPDLALLDARLPDMDGHDVCRLLRSEFPDTVVAMLTTFPDASLVRQCVRAGAQGYLLKEILGPDLAMSIRALARGEPVIDPRVMRHVVAAARQAALSHDSDDVLSCLQLEILRLVAHGFPNREIGDRLGLSDLTIKSYLEVILKQLGARNRVHAAVFATARGWLYRAGDENGDPT
jgi:two-component system, NarL family, response regulator DevR